MMSKVSSLEQKKYFNAIEFMKERHGDQLRSFSLTPYYTHPIRVASLVMKFKESHKIDDLIYASLFHDLVEDTLTTIDEIKALYNPIVASLIDELTSNKQDISCLGKVNYLSIKMTRMSSWALVIKLCDRLDNVNDFIYAPDSFVKKYSAETREILSNLLRERSELSKTHLHIINIIKKSLDIGESSERTYD
jgi:(p)ppGpp synthase/HD superfamily hydrolase